MNICFISAQKCAFKLDGIYLGTVSKNYKTLDTEGEHLFEFIPESPEYYPVSYLFKNSSESEKNSNVKITDLSEGCLFEIAFKKKPPTGFKLIEQGKLVFSGTNYVYTLFKENYIKFIIENAEHMAVENLPFEPEQVKFDICNNGPGYIIFYFISVKTYIVAFSANGKLEPVFRNLADSYNYLNGVLSVTERKNDILKHTVNANWSFGREITLKDFSVVRSSPIYRLTDKLLPFAFFEEVMLDADVSDFLAPKIRGNASTLKKFLGEIKSVMPPPHFIKNNAVLLKYADSYKYAVPEYSDGLISNISVFDNLE